MIPCTTTIRSLMYVMVYTRLDIAHTIRVISGFLMNPRNENWTVVKMNSREFFRHAQVILMV